MNTKYMKIAIEEAKKAEKVGEIPVGAVIVCNNTIISQAHNIKEKTLDPTNHAEIIAIKKACKKLKNWRLEDCIIYVTMEPCMMCCGAIEQSRIKKIVYGVNNYQFGSTSKLNNTEIISNVLEDECKKLIQLFFQKKR